MFKNCLIVVGCFFGAICQTAFAENNGYYAEAAYSSMSVSDKSSNDYGTWKPAVVRLSIGKVFADNWAIEGIFSQGVTTDTVIFSTATDFKVEAKTGYGFALRPFIKATEDLELYGRIGWMQNNLTHTVVVNSATYSTTDYAWSQYLGSVGVAYKINQNFNAIVDYSVLTTTDEKAVNLTAIGVRYNF